MSNSSNTGWMEYSKLVLKELNSLGSDIKKLQEQIHDLKSELIVIKGERTKVQEVVDWKARIDEIASPSQLATLKKEVEHLKLFKTKAITVFAVVQFAMAVIVFAQRFM